LLVFALVYFAFVQVFYILHVDLLEFHTVIASLETCFTMLLNKFKFGSIRETSLTAAAMFFAFAISCSFILINVMLTIIMEAFEQVQADLAERGNRYEILDFVKFQSRLHLGTEDLEPTESTLKKDRGKSEYDDDDADYGMEDDIFDDSGNLNEDNNTKELPHKVDQLLNRINDDYFDGELNLADKSLLANSNLYVGDPNAIARDPNDVGQKKKKRQETFRQVFNADGGREIAPPRPRWVERPDTNETQEWEKMRPESGDFKE